VFAPPAPVRSCPERPERGWTVPPQTVETEANGESWRTYERGPWLVRLACSSRYNTCRFLSCLGCSSQPRTKYYFTHCTLFHFISPRVGQQHGQAVVLDRLSLCLWSFLKMLSKLRTASGTRCKNLKKLTLFTLLYLSHYCAINPWLLIYKIHSQTINRHIDGGGNIHKFHL
jgi:hypothetical protein